MLDRILVVDDESIVLDVLSEVLSREGFQVSTAHDASSALEVLAAEPYELVLCDIRMPGLDGFEFMRQVHRAYPATDVVLMTGYASLDGAIDAMTLGAADYLIKPLKPKEVGARIRAILHRRRLEAELHALQSEMRSRYEIHHVVAFSARMRAVLSAVRRIAESSDPVVVCGEPGSGRRFVAQTLHTASKRRDQASATLRCGNPLDGNLGIELFGLVKNGRRVVRGQLDRCRGGSLHLAEFESLSRELQLAVFEMLQSGAYTPIDGAETTPLETRISIGLSAPVADLIARGVLAPEIARLKEYLTINVPPLRLRLEDLPGLVSAFVDSYALDNGQSLRVAPEALKVFVGYEFPGNVAELFAILSHAAKNSLNGLLTVELVERSFRQAVAGTVSATPMSNQLDDREYQLVLRSVNRHPGRLDQAAKELGISRTTLWRRMRKYDIRLPARRDVVAD